ncbi:MULTISPECIES: ribokinase [Frankia]|uniref:Ribokinase n=1 Tax=Frankia alni (strain DSM 45986 / CECT 9034 / ACN14a) TaxID=326424 RepID=Q0RSL9_FRAAA|nr:MULTISPECIES: ribokinase [Frankia]CAJ59440.1 putative Ribokinase [Frankia alni ACN14a]
MGRVVVVGWTSMDVTTRVARIPRPGETVTGSAVTLSPGGRGANQAVAARRLGAETVMVGAVGSDGFGSALREFLRGEAVDVTPLAVVDGPSGTAVTTVDEAGESVIVIVPGANAAVSAGGLDALRLGPGDVVLLQNEIPAAVNATALTRARAAGARTVLNAAPRGPVALNAVPRQPAAADPFTAAGPFTEADPFTQAGRFTQADPFTDAGRFTEADLLAAADVILLDEHEFAGLVPAAVGVGSLPGPQALVEVRGLLADGAGPNDNIVVTLGGAGVCARIAGTVVTLAARRVPVVDTAGADDCFCGAFGAGLAGGLPAATALFHANLAATIAVQRPGAGPAMPTRAELDDLLTGGGP